MRRGPVSFEAAVRALREMTAQPADGTATRARVLARASRGVERHARRRWATVVAVGLGVLASASAALTATGRGRRVAAISVLADAVVAPGPLSSRGRPTRVIPAAFAEPASRATGTAVSEDQAYARAHRAHFVDDAPAAALVAWDDYLRAYPTGVFAPEARYNRALCLARLGRFAEAARALRPIAKGRPGAYRQREAALLLEWLHDR